MINENMNNQRGDRMVQRLVALALSLLMSFQLLPVTVFAAEPEPTLEEQLTQAKGNIDSVWTSWATNYDKLVDHLAERAYYAEYELTDAEYMLTGRGVLNSSLNNDLSEYANDYCDALKAFVLASPSTYVDKAEEVDELLLTWQDKIDAFAPTERMQSRINFYDGQKRLNQKYADATEKQDPGSRAASEANDAAGKCVLVLKELVRQLEGVRLALGHDNDLAERLLTSINEKDAKYLENLATVEQFAQNYLTAMKESASYTDVYNYGTAGKKVNDVQDNLTWYEAGRETASHTDTAERYADIDIETEMASQITAVRAILAENEALLGELKESWKKLYDALDRMDPGFLTASKTDIEGKITAYQADWTTHKSANVQLVENTYYSKRFPRYKFSSNELFTQSTNADIKKYTSTEVGLELAYITDSEWYQTSGGAAALSLRKALYDLTVEDTDNPENNGIVKQTVDKWETLAVNVEAEAQLYELEQTLREKRLALDEWFTYSEKNTGREDVRKPITSANDFYNKFQTYQCGYNIDDLINNETFQKSVDEWQNAMTRYTAGCFDWLTKTPREPYYLLQKLVEIREMLREEAAELKAAKSEAVKADNEDYKFYIQIMDYRINAVTRLLNALEAEVTSAQAKYVVKEVEGQKTAAKSAALLAISPYTEEKLKALEDEELGVGTVDGVAITKTVAIRNYLRLQKMELQVWYDVALETVEQDKSILAGTNYEWKDLLSADKNVLTTYNRYDLQWSIVENKAMAAQLEVWLEDVEDLLDEYDAPVEPGTGSASAESTSVSTAVDAAKTAFDKAVTAYASATNATKAAKTAYDTATTKEDENTARIAYNKAQVAEQDAKKARDDAEIAYYKAVLAAGNAALTGHVDNEKTWSDAYRGKLVTDAANAYNAKNGEYESAKTALTTAKGQLKTAETTMDQANTAAQSAMATYSDLLAQLIAAEATIKTYQDQASTLTGKTKALYDAAVASKTKIDGENGSLKTAENALNTATQAYNDAVKAYHAKETERDQWEASATSLKLEAERLKQTRDELEAQRTEGKDVFPKVTSVNPEDAQDYTAYALETMVDQAERGIRASGDVMVKAYAALSDPNFWNDVSDEAAAAKGELIYNFRKSAWEFEGQQTSKKNAEAALAAKYRPVTLESATYAARVAVQNYYYAQRAYDEFQLMEAMYAERFYDAKREIFSRGVLGLSSHEINEDLRDKYGYAVYKNNGDQGYLYTRSSPDAVALALAGQVVRGDYEQRLGELKQELADAEAAMNEALDLLRKQEIAHEKTLKAATAIQSRVNELQLEYIEKDQVYSSLATKLTEKHDTFVNKEAANSGATLSYFSEIKAQTYVTARVNQTSHTGIGENPDFEKFGDFAPVFQSLGSATKTNVDIGVDVFPTSGESARGALVQWMNCYGSDDYRNSYVEYKVAEALYQDENGGRDKMLARINRMGDQYALQVSTQSTNGNGVLFFTVVYTDEEGFERKEYIFPFLDGYKKTMEEAAATLAETMPGAGTDGKIDPAKCIVNQDHVDTMARLGQVGSIAENTPLSEWGSDIYLFRTQYKMGLREGSSQDQEYGDNFRYFEVFTERQDFKDASGKVNANIKNSWSLSGMRLLHVTDFYGMSVYGYGGGPKTLSQLEFQGQQIGNLLFAGRNGGTISWVTDDMQGLGDGTNALFAGIDHKIIEFSTGKVGPNSGAGQIDKVSDEDSEFLFKLDFSDFYGAGIEGLVNLVTDTRAKDRVLQETSGQRTPVASGTSVDPSGQGTGVGSATSISTAGMTNSIDPSEKTSIKDLGLAECLTFNVVYYDTAGTRRQVALPVVASSLAWAVDHGVDENEKIFGYAQQGDSIVFSAYLPEATNIAIEECTLVFDYVDWAMSAESSALAKSNFAQRKGLITLDKEILLDGIQIYAPGTYQASTKVVQGVIVPTITEVSTPMYYQTADGSSRGLSYNYGNKSIHPEMKAYTGDDVLTPVRETGNNKFMLVIETDTPLLAGTEVSPSIELHYTTQSGRSMISASANVAENGRDFYGYWPGMGNKDVTVLQATGAGGQLKLLYDIGDFSKFDSVHIKMPENTNDDWQISGLYLMQLTEIGDRFAVWENITNGEELVTDRRYERLVEGQVITAALSNKVLLQAGDEAVINFENGANLEAVATETDWEKVRYYMTEEDAQSELGFTKTRETYTVKVQVNDEGASTVADGDCGSVNNFYFQLVFANGRSAYVLANQQLSGDGFRTGYIESFTINTNRDYGELQAVRIIPDDNSADSEIFDKLNIKRIRVSRNSDESVNRTWVVTDIGDNGWISFDYHDDAESYGILGRPGRSEADLCVNCPVGYATYSTKLLFALSTGQASNNDLETTLAELTEGITDEAKKEQLRKVLEADVQYQGQLSMTLYYRNVKGNVEPMTVDVIGAMAAYANKVADREERMDADGNVITGSQYLSTKEYMFRPGHTDRFEVDVSDIIELVSVDLIPTGVSTQSAFWNVSGLDVFMLRDAGILNINVNNEYEKTNTLTAERLCGAMNMPFTYWCPASNPEKMTFSFTSNKLDVDTTTASWEVAPSRVPDSHNDTANIYMYGTAAFGSEEEYRKIYTQIQYTTSYGQVYNASMREMSVGRTIDEKDVFYTTGVDIANISVLNKLKVKLTAAANTFVAERIVIQQVRDSVVIATYVMDLSKVDTGERTVTGAMEKYFCPTGDSINGTTFGKGDKQVVTIGFGADTTAARLVSQNRDIGVAIRYTSVNDVGGLEYNSPYVYLTDQDIIAITAGGTAQLTFREQGVKEITGVVLLCTGGVKATVNAASVELWKAELQGNTETYVHPDNYWYSVVTDTPITLELGGQTLEVYQLSQEGAQKRIATPYTVEVTSGDRAPTGAVKMVLTYTKAGTDGNTEYTKTFDDIRFNLVSGSIAPNSSAVIRVMLNDSVAKVTKVSFEPQSDNETWKINSLKTCVERTGEGIFTEEAIVATKASPAEYDVTVLNDINLIVNVTSDGANPQSSALGDIVFNAVTGQKVNINATFSKSGVKGVATVQRRDADSATWTDVPDALTVDETVKTGTGWKFTSNYDNDAMYRITVKAKDYDKCNTVEITLNYTAVSPETPTQDDGFELTNGTLTLTARTGEYALAAKDGRKVAWTSSNDQIAYYQDGKVYAGPASHSGVTATITAMDTSGNTASCVIKFNG